MFTKLREDSRLLTHVSRGHWRIAWQILAREQVNEATMR